MRGGYIFLKRPKKDGFTTLCVRNSNSNTIYLVLADFSKLIQEPEVGEEVWWDDHSEIFFPERAVEGMVHSCKQVGNIIKLQKNIRLLEYIQNG